MRIPAKCKSNIFQLNYCLKAQPKAQVIRGKHFEKKKEMGLSLNHEWHGVWFEEWFNLKLNDVPWGHSMSFSGMDFFSLKNDSI